MTLGVYPTSKFARDAGNCISRWGRERTAGSADGCPGSILSPESCQIRLEGPCDRVRHSEGDNTGLAVSFDRAPVREKGTEKLFQQTLIL